MIRHGKDVAAILQVPPADWTERLVTFAAVLRHRGETRATFTSPPSAALFKIHLCQPLAGQRARPGRPSFRIPAYLQDLWKGSPQQPHRPRDLRMRSVPET